MRFLYSLRVNVGSGNRARDEGSGKVPLARGLGEARYRLHSIIAHVVVTVVQFAEVVATDKRVGRSNGVAVAEVGSDLAIVRAYDHICAGQTR